MPWWLAPAIMGGSQVLGKIFGGDEGGLSPEMQRLLSRLESMYAEGLPESISAPISARYGAFKQGISEKTGEALGPGSGLEMAHLKRATAGEARGLGMAETQWKMGLLDRIAQITGQTRPRPGWGQTMGGVGGVFGQAYGEKEEWDEIMEILGKIHPELMD